MVEVAPRCSRVSPQHGNAWGRFVVVLDTRGTAWYNTGVGQNTDTTKTPNAWRIYDSYGDHVATVYEADMRDAWLAREGYTAQPVAIKDPRW